ncbi:hypothetical protein D3C79_906130 [compost metagenome]
MRLSRSEKESLFITRASMLGVEIPVLLTKMMASISSEEIGVNKKELFFKHD